MSEQRLAAAVVGRAISDFQEGFSSPHEDKESRVAAALASLERRIEAGEFLLERDDAVTRFWFYGAGLKVAAVHTEGHRRGWYRRLAALRGSRTVLQRKLVVLQCLHPKGPWTVTRNVAASA